jgi:hypothetical protein
MDALNALAVAWRDRAGQLRAWAGAEGAARAWEAAAAELDTAIREAGGEALTLSEAARESGYAVRTLRQLVADGKLPNAGRKNAPRILRADLPRRAKARTDGGTDNNRRDAMRLVRGAS